MKDELKEVFELADDLRSKVKKIIKKSKVDADKADFDNLPPYYEVTLGIGGYFYSYYGSPSDPYEPYPTRQAAIARAWASYARDIEAENDSHRQIAADSEIPQAIRDVLAERKRLEVNGFTLDQDRNGVFSDAAAALLLYEQEIAEDIWPFDSEFNPKDHRDNFVRAGALILAEIERLDRLAAKEADHG